MSLDLLWKIAIAIYLAGVLVANVRRGKLDLNGLGARVRREKEIADFRFLTDVVARLVYEDDHERRRQLGKMFLDAALKGKD